VKSRQIRVERREDDVDSRVDARCSSVDDVFPRVGDVDSRKLVADWTKDVVFPRVDVVDARKGDADWTVDDVFSRKDVVCFSVARLIARKGRVDSTNHVADSRKHVIDSRNDDLFRRFDDDFSRVGVLFVRSTPACLRRASWPGTTSSLSPT
jgi:hypothetical protein